MKYISIDIETTGLDPDKHQVIEFAAILEDTNSSLPVDKLPFYYKTVRNATDTYTIDPAVVKMHLSLFNILDQLRYNLESDTEWVWEFGLATSFREWLDQQGFEGKKIVIAGKNFGWFDARFLRRQKNWEIIQHHQRFLDPVLGFIDDEKDDVPPDMATCKERAGLSPEVAHTAYEDAKDVIRLLRFYFGQEILK